MFSNAISKVSNLHMEIIYNDVVLENGALEYCNKIQNKTSVM